MGQVPPKSFLPSAPYGASEATNALNPSQPSASNPQTPLLPPNFQDPGTMQSQSQSVASQPGSTVSKNPFGGNPRNMLRGLFGAILFLLLAPSLWATTSVTGSIKNLGTASVTPGSFVRLWLRGCAGNQPRVNGTGVIAPSQGGVFFFDIAADASGNISGTIYSTRDNAGTGNGDIECGGSKTAVWYGMQIFFAGKGGPEVAVHAKNSATLDITQVTPITTNPVVTSPTGDTTYARLDAGNQPFSGRLSAPNYNDIRVVDGVVFTTIDAAVTNCGASPCTVAIPSTYAGAESSHLVTSTLGYIFYKPVANETVIDNRYITGTSRPNYSYTFNGQNLGQLSRFGVTQSCSSPLDSCVGATITNFISNTMPANNGTQTGMVSIAAVTGSITRGASGARVVAHEGYVSLDATAADTPFADVRGFTSSINIDRATSVQGCVTCAAYTAAAHTNISASGATIVNAYGFDGQLQTVGTSRNFSYHSIGNFLFENGASMWAVDLGGTPRQLFTFRSDNGIDFQPLADAVGWNWKTQGGSGLFTVTSASIISRIVHQFAAAAEPSVAGGAALGAAALPWSSVFIGAAATNNIQITGTATAARVATLPDGNSSTVMPASLVTTAAASDNVTVTGMTASGHCTFSPTNAAGATNIATTFISAKAANQITVSHTASANLNYDIFCTPN